MIDDNENDDGYEDEIKEHKSKLKRTKGKRKIAMKIKGKTSKSKGVAAK